jgi:hypothetical protein
MSAELTVIVAGPDGAPSTTATNPTDLENAWHPLSRCDALVRMLGQGRYIVTDERASLPRGPFQDQGIVCS